MKWWTFRQDRPHVDGLGTRLPQLWASSRVWICLIRSISAWVQSSVITTKWLVTWDDTVHAWIILAQDYIHLIPCFPFIASKRHSWYLWNVNGIIKNELSLIWCIVCMPSRVSLKYVKGQNFKFILRILSLVSQVPTHTRLTNNLGLVYQRNSLIYNATIHSFFLFIIHRSKCACLWFEFTGITK